MYYILGSGNIGTALSALFAKRNIAVTVIDSLSSVRFQSGDMLFLAVPDDTVRALLPQLKRTDATLVHFAAAVGADDAVLLHPYASVRKETDLSKIFFTVWGKQTRAVEDVLNMLGMKYRYVGDTPGVLYHASAVIGGNFSHFLFEAGIELLIREGIERNDAVLLLTQLVQTSLSSAGSGPSGFTGPVARGDEETVRLESEKLQERYPETARLFDLFVSLIEKSVQDGTILR